MRAHIKSNINLFLIVFMFAFLLFGIIGFNQHEKTSLIEARKTLLINQRPPDVSIDKWSVTRWFWYKVQVNNAMSITIHESTAKASGFSLDEVTYEVCKEPGVENEVPRSVEISKDSMTIDFKRKFTGDCWLKVVQSYKEGDPGVGIVGDPGVNGVEEETDDRWKEGGKP